MKINGIKYTTLRGYTRKQMKDPAFRKEWKLSEPEYQLERLMIEARIKKGMTQTQIAERAGTTQSAIARFESGTSNPTLSFIQRLAEALDADLRIRIVRNRTAS